MFSHVMVGTNDLSRSKTFYDKIMPTLGYAEGMMDPKGRCFYLSKTGAFGITRPINGEDATHANGGTIGFMATSRDVVDAWHEAGIQAGGQTCEDPPGIRTNTFGKLYTAYLRDPDGNKLCALFPIKD